MYDFKEHVKRENGDVLFLLKEAKKKLGNKHPGSLSIKTINGEDYYYETKRIKGKIKQRYLGKAGDEKLGEFILLKVLEKRVILLKENLETLKYYRSSYHDYSTDVILNSLGDKYENALWKPNTLDELNQMGGRASWEVSEYNDYGSTYTEKKNFERDIITCDGTHVRSKGECIIYDLLKSVNIVFEYEPELLFYNEDFNLIAVHPDFYIECRDGSHIIIEHLGLLNNEDYAEAQEKKLRMYHLNGYDLGHNMVMTSDNTTSGLDSGFISDLINGVILKRARTTR